MKQVNEQKTSILKNETSAMLRAAIQNRLEGTEVMSAGSSVSDVKATGEGVVTISLNGMSDLNYSEPGVKRNVYCTAVSSVSVKMSADLARKLKPGTPVMIFGKPAFSTSSIVPGQQLVWVQEVGYLSVTDYKVMVGKLVFDPP